MTIARWRSGRWRPVAAEHPVEKAHASLDAVAPLVTGDPQTSIDGLVANAADSKDLKELSNADLLRAAAREFTIVLIVVTRAIGEKAASLFTSKPGELAAALVSGN